MPKKKEVERSEMQRLIDCVREISANQGLDGILKKHGFDPMTREERLSRRAR